MMETQQSNPVSKPTSQAEAQRAKQPWRKPGLTIMPLNVTANGGGSVFDGETNGPQTPG